MRTVSQAEIDKRKGKAPAVSAPAVKKKPKEPDVVTQKLLSAVDQSTMAAIRAAEAAVNAVKKSSGVKTTKIINVKLIRDDDGDLDSMKFTVTQQS